MSIELQVANQRFSGWKQARVTRSIEALAGAFTAEVTHDEANLADLLAFEEGQACTVLVDGVVVLRGVIDTFDGDVNNDAATVTLAGRDATGVLTQCAAHPFGSVRQWLNQPIDRIVKDLLEPYGLPAIFNGNLGQPWPQFTLEPAETVLDALRRLTQARGLLLIPDKQGGLVVANPSTTLTPTALRLGDNLFSGSVNYSDADRYSTITVYGQQQTTPTANGRTTNGATATVTDPSVTGYRPYAVQAQGQATQADCLRQAQWLMASHNGKAKQLRITLPFWRQAPNAPLWDINQLVQIDAAGPPLYTTEAMLISDVIYTVDRHLGQQVELTLLRPAALTPEPIPTPPPPKAATPARKANAPRRAKAQPTSAVGLYKVVNGQMIRVLE